MIDLSVLICSTHTRHDTFGRAIQEQVWGQLEALSEADRDRVEVLMLTDNKRMMLGQKRNVLVDMAQGRYVVFVDDDDRLEPDYLSSLLGATEMDADVITFLVSVSLNGEAPKICRYSKDFTADRNTADGYQRLPNHICAVRRTIASKLSFPNIPYGEDSAYSKLLLPHLRHAHDIPRVLYHYDYSSETTETQQHLSAPMRRRNQDPLVDVVILSDARTPELQRMTQHAIDTCVAGANCLPINVIVMEQQHGVVYQHGNVLHSPQDFHYNAFANRGARLGSAEWIMVANNDLIFHDGWLHHLLAADHPVVSPKNPGDMRQADVTRNAAGLINGRHFSGWCFMIKRALWREMGGFDPDFAFWCADDAVIEQVHRRGVTPMLVPAAVVEHLGSVTLNQSEGHDDLTWAQVDWFNCKYDRNKFSDEPLYQKWRDTHGSAE